MPVPLPPALPILSFGVLILAAGASSRMGAPKLLLPWATTSVVGHLIAQWHTAGAAQIALVLAAGDQLLPRELQRLGFPAKNLLFNPAPQEGMFSSIRCAAAWSGWAPGLTHWAIVLGDQPHLRSETLSDLLNLGATHPNQVCQLSRQGRPRHPVVLPANSFNQLAYSAHGNLKEFLQSLPLPSALQESNDAGLDLDLDRPADYETALRLFAPQD